MIIMCPEDCLFCQQRSNKIKVVVSNNVIVAQSLPADVLSSSCNKDCLFCKHQQTAIQGNEWSKPKFSYEKTITLSNETCAARKNESPLSICRYAKLQCKEEDTEREPHTGKTLKSINLTSSLFGKSCLFCTHESLKTKDEEYENAPNSPTANTSQFALGGRNFLLCSLSKNEEYKKSANYITTTSKSEERKRYYTASSYETNLKKKEYPPPYYGLLAPRKLDDELFVCRYCGLTGDSQMLMIKHTKEKHPGDLYFVCCIENCQKSYKTHGFYTRHVVKDHRSYYKAELFPCVLCDAVFIDQYYLNVHKTLRHRNTHKLRVICTECGSEMWKNFLGSHLALHQSKSAWKYRCRALGCEELFPHLSRLGAHEKRVHKM